MGLVTALSHARPETPDRRHRVIGAMMDNPKTAGRKEPWYSLSEKGAFLIITLSGTLAKQSIGVLEKCMAEITKSTATKIVVDCGNLTEIDVHGVAPFIRLQKTCRDKGEFRLCSIRLSLKIFLDEKGAVRGDEICPTLKEAILALK